MTIEKKSLISSLKTTKKANVAASTPAKKEGASTRKNAVRQSRVQLKKVFDLERM
jgi:hypothetical protein